MRKITEEGIKQMSKTKLEQSRQKIIDAMNNNIIPEQSDNKLPAQSTREKERITFEQFKNMMNNGETLTSLSKKYSKHQIGFYSALSQGKITLSREKFEEEYLKGVSLEKIGKDHNIPREHITYLRDYYGIKLKGWKYQRRLKNEVDLSQDAKDIIIGSILGDGHITPAGYFSEKHSPKQLEYLQWKASFLSSITTDKSWDYREYIDKRSGNLIKSHSFRTTAHSFLYDIRDMFYKKEGEEYKKIIPDTIESLMTEKIFTILFMDDGSTDWGMSREYEVSPWCKISMQGFSEQYCLKLISAINNKFSLNGKRNKRGEIIFNTKCSKTILEIGKRFSVPCLMYKFDKNEYKKLYTALI